MTESCEMSGGEEGVFVGEEKRETTAVGNGTTVGVWLSKVWANDARRSFMSRG